jgi:hypothetical protein
MNNALFRFSPSSGWKQYALRFVLIVILVFVSFCGGWVAHDEHNKDRDNLVDDVSIRIDPDSGDMTLRGSEAHVARIERLIRFGIMPLPGEVPAMQ